MSSLPLFNSKHLNLIKTSVPSLSDGLQEIIAEYMPAFGELYDNFDLEKDDFFCRSYSIGPDGLCYSIYGNHHKVLCHDRKGNIIKSFECAPYNGEETEFATSIHCGPLINDRGIFYIYFYNFEMSELRIYTSNERLFKVINNIGQFRVHSLAGIGLYGNLCFLANPIDGFVILNPEGEFLFDFSIKDKLNEKGFPANDIITVNKNKLYTPLSIFYENSYRDLIYVLDQKYNVITKYINIGPYKYDVDYWYGPVFYNGRAYLSNSQTQKIIMFTDDFETVVDEFTIDSTDNKTPTQKYENNIIFNISQDGFIYILSSDTKKMMVFYA